MNTFVSEPVTRTYLQHIEAPPASVFPLICPVREAEWLEGWGDAVEIVHSRSGVAEEGCVFRTRAEGQPETVWMITRHDAGRGLVEFVRVTPGLVATRLRVEIEAGADGGSTVRVTYTFVPVSAAGAELVREKHSEAAFRRSLEWWERSMNHWLRTGETLRAA
jgi:hypothetical protein